MTVWGAGYDERGRGGRLEGVLVVWERVGELSQKLLWRLGMVVGIVTGGSGDCDEREWGL